MATRLAVIAVVALAACGCKSIRSVKSPSDRPLALTSEEAGKMRDEGVKLYTEQPRTLIRVTQAAQLLEPAARTLRDDFDTQWQAAQALTFLAENEDRPVFKLEAAENAVTLARHARELRLDRVEGHYWYAIAVGLLADADRSYGLSAVGEMEPALKRAIEIDERYDMAGPLRTLGILHLRTPAPPASIGSPRKGLKLLQRATELFPDYPENFLYLAEALRDNDRVDEARVALQKVMDAAPWPDREFESTQWKAQARELQASPPKP